MYKRIEESYKNESLELKFNKDILIGLIIIMCISFPFCFNEDWIFIIFIFGLLYIYYYMGKQLGYKLKWAYRKSWFNVVDLLSNFKKKLIKEEKNLILKILKKENVDSNDKLVLLIEHYREKSNNSVLDFNFLTLLPLVISIFWEVVKLINNIELGNVLSYLLVTIILYTYYYLFAKQVLDFISVFRKNKHLYMSLEEKFTEVYMKGYFK